MKRTLGLMLLSLALLQGATGCRYSEDRHVYESTYMSPKSVFVQEKLSKKTVFSKEIPPQHILVVEFDGKADGWGEIVALDSGYATSLRWELYPLNATRGFFRRDHYYSASVESGTIELEGNPIVINMLVGKPIDPDTVPRERTEDEIRQDLPEPGNEALPEPDEAEATDKPVNDAARGEGE